MPRELQHDRRPGHRRSADLSRRRHVRRAVGADAQGRPLLRRDHPPGADRRRPARSGRQLRGVRPVGRRGPRLLRADAAVVRPSGAVRRDHRHSRHGLRRHRPGAGPVPQTPARHPRHRGVVHLDRHAARLRPRRLRAPVRNRPAEPRDPDRPLRRRGAGRRRDRHRLRHADGPVHLARRVPRPVQAVPQAGQRPDPRAKLVEDVHPLLRQRVGT